MLGAAHACANPLTARYDLAHGLALSILLPHVVRWNAVACRRALRAAGRRIRSSAPAATKLAQLLERFAAAAGLGGRLRDHGVTAEALPELAALAAQQWTGTFNPRPFDAAGALDLYRSSF